MPRTTMDPELVARLRESVRQAEDRTTLPDGTATLDGYSEDHQARAMERVLDDADAQPAPEEAPEPFEMEGSGVTAQNLYDDDYPQG